MSPASLVGSVPKALYNNLTYYFYIFISWGYMISANQGAMINKCVYLTNVAGPVCLGLRIAAVATSR